MSSDPNDDDYVPPHPPPPRPPRLPPKPPSSRPPPPQQTKQNRPVQFNNIPPPLSKSQQMSIDPGIVKAKNTFRNDIINLHRHSTDEIKKAYDNFNQNIDKKILNKYFKQEMETVKNELIKRENQPQRNQRQMTTAQPAQSSQTIIQSSQTPDKYPLGDLAEFMLSNERGSGKKTKIHSVHFKKDAKLTSAYRLNFIKNRLKVKPLKRAHVGKNWVSYRITEPNTKKKYRTKIINDNLHLIIEF